MTHEVIRREEARLLRILEEYPVNGRKTNTGTIKMIRKEIGNMQNCQKMQCECELS